MKKQKFKKGDILIISGDGWEGMIQVIGIHEGWPSIWKWLVYPDKSKPAILAKGSFNLRKASSSELVLARLTHPDGFNGRIFDVGWTSLSRGRR